MGRALLIVVAGLAILLGSMQSNLHTLENGSTEVLAEQYSRMVSRNIANGNMYRALNQMWRDHPVAWMAGYEGGALGGTYELNVFGRTPFDTTLEFNQYRLESRAWFDEDTVEVEVVIEKPSFARFAWFTESEAGVAWVDGDTVQGPVHTNGFLTMSGTPVFMDDVSSAGLPPGAPPSWAGGGSPDFQADTTFGRPAIELPEASIAELCTLAVQGGRRFHHEVWLRVMRDISLNPIVRCWDTWPIVPPSGAPQGLPVPAAGDSSIQIANISNGILATTGGFDVHIWGQLDGRLTVVSTDDIYIETDLLYFADPLLFPTSDDMLGLIAADSVIVAYKDNGASPTRDPNESDCRINATILAMSSFTTQGVTPPFSGPSRGTIYLLGGIIQETRGRISFTFGPTTYGYGKDYEYDRRLLTQLPPAFPLYGDNVILSWRE